MSEKIITCLWLIYFTTVRHEGSAGDYNPQFCLVNANSMLTDSTWGLIRFQQLKAFLQVKNSRKLKTKKHKITCMSASIPEEHICFKSLICKSGAKMYSIMC